MKLNRLTINPIIILLFFVSIGNTALAQNSEKSVTDSLRILPLQLSEIPIRSSETLIMTRKILEDLVSDEEIAKLKHLNDSILNLVVEENIDFFAKKIESKSVRFLENRTLYLKNQKIIVENEKKQLSEIIYDLAKSIKYLTDEKKVWTKTRTVIVQSGFSEAMIKRTDLIIDKLDNALTIVSFQAESILSTLDRSSEISIEIDVILGNLEKSIRELEEQLLQNDYPDIFSLEYSKENLKFGEAFIVYVNTEWVELKSYLLSRSNEYFITLILFALLLYVFFNYQSVFNNYQNNADTYYQRKLGIILSKPISAALILTLFATVAIFPDRPPAFRDLVFILFVIPIVIIMLKLLDKKLWIFVYGIPILILLNMILLMLPPENIIFRYNLLFIALTEIYFAWFFLFRSLKKLTILKYDISLFRFIGYLFLIMATIGFFSALSGNILLSKKVLFAFSSTIIAIAIIYASVITVSGLFISFLESKTAMNINFIKNHEKFLKTGFLNILNLGAVLYTLHLVLVRLSLWKTLKEAALEFLQRDRIVGEIEFSIGSVLIFFVVIYISIILGRIIHVILEGDILDRMSLKKGMPHTISMMVRYTFVSLGVLLAISATGMKLSSMTIVIGAFSVGIGFGLQGIFNNIVSGLILLFDRPVKIGDTIEVGTLIGKVNHIGIRTSNVKTFDGAEVIVPNGQLISNEVINWTLSDQQRRIEVRIGVSYSSDPHLVYEVLMDVLNQHKDVMLYPQPQVLFSELGESSLDFRLLFWTESIGEWLRIQSEITFKAFDKLKENGIEIPFPQRDLHIKGIDQQLNTNIKSVDKK